MAMSYGTYSESEMADLHSNFSGKWEQFNLVAPIEFHLKTLENLSPRVHFEKNNQHFC